MIFNNKNIYLFTDSTLKIHHLLYMYIALRDYKTRDP